MLVFRFSLNYADSGHYAVQLMRRFWSSVEELPLPETLSFLTF